MNLELFTPGGEFVTKIPQTTKDCSSTMKKLKIRIIIGLFSLSGNLFAQSHLPKFGINEFMASNTKTIQSPDYHEAADWLEIYNPADSTVEIGGCYLTDDLSDPQKWQIPSGTKISAGGTFLFWADDRDEGCHTNFKLSASGEQIGLFSPTGALIDSVTFGEQQADVSFGRFPDGGDDWFFFDQPTPAATNQNPGFHDRIAAPEFSPGGGFFDGAQWLELTAEIPDDTIRFTLDGSLPNSVSAIYSVPIRIAATTVIRAQTVRAGGLVSNVETHTYLIDEPTTLPVVSVATDPANLWDDEIGIYVEGTNGIPGYCSSDPKNWNQPWERPVSLELYEATRELAFKLDAGMQIGGGCTRKYPQKALAIYVRSEYGTAKINYPLFPDKPITRYNNILLRNSGQDWWRALFRDGMMHTLVKNRMDIDWQAYKPAIVYLNGEYWGIHGIREKHNEHYLESNYGIDPDAIDILDGNASVKQGSPDRYKALISYIQTHNLAVPEHYEWVKTQMDIREYQNYIIAEIYCANIDWPGGNIKYWRQHGENHKWRWILFDTDLGFGAHELGQANSNTLENATATTATYYANPPWSTFLLRKLLENTEFRTQFIQRFASHLNTTFKRQRVLPIIDSLKTILKPEIPRHIEKWTQSTSFNAGWEYHVNVMRDFAIRRPDYVRGHLMAKFGLSGTAQLAVNANDPQMGLVSINGVALPGENFSGSYFKDLPLECCAVPNPGYRFVGWQGLSTANDDSIAVILTGDATLTALFEIDASDEFSGVCINEFLALNARTLTDAFGDFDDWIELYNRGPQIVDIGGLYVTDDLSEPDKWQIPATAPEATTIQPGGFLLLWADREMNQGVLHVDVKLSGDGEAIGLAQKTDHGFVMIDSLVFGPQTEDLAFGRFPDGSAEFRILSQPTPGSANSFTHVPDGNREVPTANRLSQNYPNPFNATTVIRYTLQTESRVKLTLYDLAGREVKILIDQRQAAGNHAVALDAIKFSSGIYVCKLTAGNFTQSRKLILLR
jgi:hypothetical protein